MTKEELRKEATFTVEWESTTMIDRPLFVHGYITGAEPEVGSSIDCEKAQKNGELCLGYSGDEDEPCERCKNCIKCEGGYYQLGETEKDEQLTKAKEILEDIIKFQPYIDRDAMFLTRGNDWKEVIFKAEQFIKDSKVEK